MKFCECDRHQVDE